jgi:protein gp37
MGKQSGISWTDATHNFWYGCEKVSQGCKFCYAERDMTRYGRNFRAVTRTKNFEAPLRWREPTSIFINSWSDFFIQEADPWRDAAWDIMQRTPWHRYLILTKRPERIAGHLPSIGDPWPWPHVSLGISAENQESYDQRMDSLMSVSSAYRFLSLEPLLGPIRLHLDCWWPLIDLVIVGGESGTTARPMPLPSFQDIVHQCHVWNVPVHTKQDSGRRAGQQGRIPDGLWRHEPPRWQPVGSIDT